MGISPEDRNPERQSSQSLMGIRTSSLFTHDYVESLLKRIEDKEKMNLTLDVNSADPRSSQTLPSLRSPTTHHAPRRYPTAHTRPSKSKIALDTRRVLEKFLERSLSLNDASPMQKVYQDYESELEIIEEDGPGGASTPRVKAKNAGLVGAGPQGHGDGHGDAKKPFGMKKVSSEPVTRKNLPSPDKDVWTKQSIVASPGSQSTKSEETLKADSTLVSDDSKSSCHIASPLTRPKSAVIAQTEFSIVNDLDSEMSPRRYKGKQKSLDNILEQPSSKGKKKKYKHRSHDNILDTSPVKANGKQRSIDNIAYLTGARPSSLAKAETISAASYDHYMKEMSTKPKDNAKENKKNGKSKVTVRPPSIDIEHGIVSPVKKSNTISASSYQDWKIEKKGMSNDKRRGSRDSEIDIIEQKSNLKRESSISTSSVSSDDYHEPKNKDDSNRKKKTGFKRAMERLRMSYRRKLERPNSINSAEYYAVKPKAPKPVFKKKKGNKSFKFLKFWKRAMSSDETDKLKNLGLNDVKLLGESLSDDSKKGVIVKVKHQHKPHKPDENALDSFISRIRKGGSTLRRKISRKESLRSPGHKSKSLDILDESPGSTLELGATTTSLPENAFLTVDSKNGGRRSKSPNNSLRPSPSPSQKSGTFGKSSPKKVTEDFGNIIRTSLRRGGQTPESPPVDSFDYVADGPPPLPPKMRDSANLDQSKVTHDRLKKGGLASHDLEVDAGGGGDDDDDESDFEEIDPSIIAQKQHEDRTEEEKEEIYEKVAMKLAEIADKYAHKAETIHESSTSTDEPTSPIVLTASTGGATGGQDVCNPLEMRLASLLRNRGDHFNENGEFPKEAVQKLVMDTTYNHFQKQMTNILPKTDGIKQIAVFFQLTKTAIQWAGVGAQQAGRIKEMSLQFFEDKFADWISDQGGWDSMVEDSSDFELD